jgi:hypothetical protein
MMKLSVLKNKLQITFIFILATLFVTSCKQKILKETIGVYCVYEKKPTDAVYEEIQLVSNKFIESSEDSIYEIKSLRIQFPNKLKEISLKDSSSCKFYFTETKEDFNPKKLKINGSINCKEIDSSLWEIDIELREIKYHGIISKKDRKANLFLLEEIK